MIKHDERRYSVGRAYYKPVSKHQVSAEHDYLYTIVITFIVGAALGATIALGWVA